MLPAGRIVPLLACLLLAACERAPQPEGRAAPLPPTDASGLAWVAADTFLVVHDAKRPEETDRPRVSLLHLPRSAAGVVWTPLDVAWPAADGPSHDLEALARVPGTDTYLLVESGDDGAAYRRIFVATYAGGSLRIEETVPWPVPVQNVEGVAVARVDTQYVFVFAERAHGRAETDLTWAPFTLRPLAFGAFASAPLRVADPTGPDARPVAALAVDPAGRLHAAAARDPEREDGPFQSVVWAVGVVTADAAGVPRVEVAAAPERLATLDGLKVESLAVRPRPDGTPELFVGTDDEFYGAIVRPLPARR